MTGRHQPRPTRFTGVLEAGGWRLKRYEITLDGGPVAADVDRAVVATLAAELPPGDGDDVGFVVVHVGAEAVWLLADLWAGDILSQHTFTAPLGAPTRFARVPFGGPTACVWELVVHAHERDVYVAHVLDPADGPHREAYLDDTLAPIERRVITA